MSNKVRQGSMAAPMARPVPTPPDFPVAWEQPGDEAYFWQMDRMHFPSQITPLADSFIRICFTVGFNQGVAIYDAPIRADARRFNTYHYEYMLPLPATPEELAARGARAQERVSATLGRLGEQWREEWLPAVRHELDAFAAFDLAGAEPAAFRAHLRETMARHGRLWTIHFALAVPMLLGMSLFQDAYRELFGDDDAFDAFRLLQGFENETLRANRALWQLSQSAAATPEVRRIIEATPSSEVTTALAGSEQGCVFLTVLDAYLDEFGRRGSDFADLDRPSWLEDPTPAIEALRGYLAEPGADPEEERAMLAAARDELLARTRARLAGYPQQASGQFEFLLKAAQEAVVLSEDHGWYIDWRGSYEVRRVLLEAGRRLVAGGMIAAADDVFYLTFEEVLAALAGEPGAYRADVTARRAEMARFSAIVPPPFVGMPPAGSPPEDPFGRAIMKFFGGPPPQAEVPGVLRGNAGAPGRVTGRALVARSLADAGRLRRGDILVAETTAPPWTPLFATASAVITDTGGMLSHCAVVAREYRIPAVVGTAKATTMLKDWDIVEVDGAAGIVRIVTPAHA
jgi:phosphohistidine swiveling domain-containing protein